MARRNFRDKLIKRENITEEIRFINGSDNGYISENGNVYIEYYPNEFYLKAHSQVWGYEKCQIQYNKKNISKRVHRLVAEAFIPNPNHYTVVGHKNNIKSDNRVCNLYWTTVQENTQKAFDDRLAQNAKGYKDSQGLPIYMCDLNWNILKDYGSIGECARDNCLHKTMIARQCKSQHKTLGKSSTQSEYKFCYQTDYNNIKNNYQI